MIGLRNISERSAERCKVLFVVNALIVGGAERHTIDLAARLAAFGFECAIATLKRGTIDETCPVEIFIPNSPETGFTEQAGRLASVLRTYNPTLIVAVNQRPLAITFAARRMAHSHAPICAVLHSTILRNAKERLMQKLYNVLYNLADQIIFISNNQRQYWLDRGFHPKAMETIQNGVDLDAFSPAVRENYREKMRHELAFDPSDFVLGSCAVLRREKNPTQLVDAVARLRSKGVPARALFVGDGPLRPAIEARARDYNLEEHIKLVGMQKDVKPYLAAFDVGVLCSTAIETLSLSALETYAMGIPMVMSNIGGASEIVIHRVTGGLFEPGNTEALVELLNDFYPQDARSTACLSTRRDAELRFDIEVMVWRYAMIFQWLATKSAAAPVDSVVSVSEPHASASRTSL